MKTQRLEFRRPLLIIRKIGLWKGILITTAATKLELSTSTKMSKMKWNVDVVESDSQTQDADLIQSERKITYFVFKSTEKSKEKSEGTGHSVLGQLR